MLKDFNILGWSKNNEVEQDEDKKVEANILSHLHIQPMNMYRETTKHSSNWSDKQTPPKGEELFETHYPKHTWTPLGGLRLSLGNLRPDSQSPT